MNFGQKALQILKTVAPTIATAVGGPFGPLASMILSTALGTPAGDTKAAEAAILSATPESLLAAKKADNDLNIRMRELGITEEQLAFADVADARKMQTATRDPTVPRLAWLVVGGFIGMGLMLSAAFLIWPEQTGKISPAAWTLLVSVVTYLASEAKQAGAFYFGSSAGSKDKDETISEIAKS